MQEVQMENQQQAQMTQQNEITKQMGQISKAPLMDPTKNPKLAEKLNEPTEEDATAAPIQ